LAPSVTLAKYSRGTERVRLGSIAGHIEPSGMQKKFNIRRMARGEMEEIVLHFQQSFSKTFQVNQILICE